MKAPLRVTFDSNVLARVLCPEEEQVEGAPAVNDQRIVHDALCDGRVEGFVSKTYFTKEVIPKRDRERVMRATFRRYNLRQQSIPERSVKCANKEAPESDRRITVTRLTRGDVLQLMRRFNVRILHTYLAGDVRIQPLKTSDGTPIEDIGLGDFYNGTDSDIMERNDECFRFIRDTLGVGVLVVDQLDVRDGKIKAEETGCDMRFGNPAAEEADIQAISTHYAHRLDVFCTEDAGKNAGGNSVMKAENKKALTERFGIRFCTLSELAKLISSTDVKR